MDNIQQRRSYMPTCRRPRFMARSARAWGWLCHALLCAVGAQPFSNPPWSAIKTGLGCGCVWCDRLRKIYTNRAGNTTTTCKVVALKGQLKRLCQPKRRTCDSITMAVSQTCIGKNFKVLSPICQSKREKLLCGRLSKRNAFCQPSFCLPRSVRPYWW